MPIALLLILVSGTLIYAGVRDCSPWDEVKAAFGGPKPRCGSPSGGANPGSTSGGVLSGSAANPKGAAAAQVAQSQVGIPYKFGGASPTAGFDCSGLVQYAYAKQGVSLPHNAAAQAAVVRPITRKDLQLGDLIFFFHPIDHVGLYIGNGKMVDAPHTGVTVRDEKIWPVPVAYGRVR